MFRQPERKSSSESSDHQGLLTLMTTSAQVVETSVNVTIKVSSYDYTYPNDHTLLTYDRTPSLNYLLYLYFDSPGNQGYESAF